MNSYFYKLYGAYYDTGYELITRTADLQKAQAILKDKSYYKVMMIRYDVLKNMDEIMAVKYNNNLSRKLKKERK